MRSCSDDGSESEFKKSSTSLERLVCMLEIKAEMNSKQKEKYENVVSILPGVSDTKGKTEQQLRQEKVKEHANDLIENSSLHGLSYIFDKRHPIRRVIWFFITTAAFCYSMQKVYESTRNFLDYPFNTARMRQYVDKIEFPAVSFCNENDMRMSVLNGTLVDAAILDHTKSGNVTGTMYRNVTKRAAHTLEEMLVDCKFNGRKCNIKNFTSFNWMQGDKCFTFNSGKEGHKILSVSGTGIERSLSMTINLQHYDYYRDGMVAGVHLILHGQDETPVRIRGPMISPGYTTYIQVEKKKVTLALLTNPNYCNGFVYSGIHFYLFIALLFNLSRLMLWSDWFENNKIDLTG